MSIIVAFGGKACERDVKNKGSGFSKKNKVNIERKRKKGEKIIDKWYDLKWRKV